MLALPLTLWSISMNIIITIATRLCVLIRQSAVPRFTQFLVTVILSLSLSLFLSFSIYQLFPHPLFCPTKHPFIWKEKRKRANQRREKTNQRRECATSLEWVARKIISRLFNVLSARQVNQTLLFAQYCCTYTSVSSSVYIKYTILHIIHFNITHNWLILKSLRLTWNLYSVCSREWKFWLHICDCIRNPSLSVIYLLEKKKTRETNVKYIIHMHNIFLKMSECMQSKFKVENVVSIEREVTNVSHVRPYTPECGSSSSCVESVELQHVESFCLYQRACTCRAASAKGASKRCWRCGCRAAAGSNGSCVSVSITGPKQLWGTFLLRFDLFLSFFFSYYRIERKEEEERMRRRVRRRNAILDSGNTKSQNAATVAF